MNKLDEDQKEMIKDYFIDVVEWITAYEMQAEALNALSEIVDYATDCQEKRRLDFIANELKEININD